MKKICIVGGGTAGWLSAAYLIKKFPNYQIQLVESPNIPTIGVGEGTWPSIMKLLNDLGVKATELIALTGGGVKLGIKFIDFADAPFWLSTDPAWETWGTDLTAAVGNNNKCPWLYEDSTHGCHFVASELADLLQKRSTDQGVELIHADITDVEIENDNCKSVTLDNGTSIEADWFVDCSGFKRILIGKTSSQFQSYAKELLVDTAIVGQKTYTNPEKEYEPFTSSIGMTAGWRFKIPVYDRTGNGYIYSSQFISDEDARAEFASATGIENPRKISMHPGYYKEIFKGNIIAAGMSSGFIEPLEATAIHLAGKTIEYAVEVIAGRRNHVWANSEIQARIRYIKVVVLGHYAFSRRTEPFWVAASKAARDSKDFQDFWHSLKYKYPTKEDNLDNGYPYFQWNELLRGFGEDHYYPKLTQDAKVQVYLAQKMLPNHYRYITEIRLKNGIKSKERLENS